MENGGNLMNPKLWCMRYKTFIYMGAFMKDFYAYGFVIPLSRKDE